MYNKCNSKERETAIKWFFQEIDAFFQKVHPALSVIRMRNIHTH